MGDVTDGVFYLHLQERIVRRSVTELIPRLAAFSPARFAESYLSASAATLLATIRSPGERDAGFMAVGDLAAALASDDADKDGADVDQSDGVSNEGTTHRAARLLGSRDGSAGYLSGSSGNLHAVGYLAQAAAQNAEEVNREMRGSLPSVRSMGSLDPGKAPNRGRAAKAFERYLPEIAGVIQETCVHFANRSNRSKANGGSDLGGRIDPGHAEALLCAGALARSMDVAWEPHVRRLLPAMFAGGLSAPLVDALEGVSNALPALVPIIQRKLIEVISNVLNPGGYVGNQGGYPGGVSTLTGRPDNSIGGSVHGNSTINSIDAIGNNNTNSVGSKLKKVFSGVFMTDKSQHGPGGHSRQSSALSGSASIANLRRDASVESFHGSPAGSVGGSAPGTPKRGAKASPFSMDQGGSPVSNSGALATASAAAVMPGSPGLSHVVHTTYNNNVPGSSKQTHGSDGHGIQSPLITSPMKQIFRRASAGGTSGGTKDKATDAAARKTHRARVQLALRTLGTFPFGAAVLLGFVRRNVIEYLDDDDPATRREAALTCCRLLEVRSDRISQAALDAANANGHSHDVHTYSTGSGDWSAGTEEFIMSRLLAVAVSDLDAGVRKAVLASFCRPCPATDSHLGQADALRALFVTLNDESPEVRLIAIRLVGRLAPRNPAYALPALRRHLLQLLAELEHSTESRMREEGARHMAALVRSCERLVTPYTSPILRVLMNKLRRPEDAGVNGGVNGAAGSEKKVQKIDDEKKDAGEQKDTNQQPNGFSLGSVTDPTNGTTPASNATNGDVGSAGGTLIAHTRAPAHIVSVREKAAVLGTIGELAQVGGVGVVSFIPALLVLIIDGIRVGSTRDVAVVTMGQLIESTGFVIKPFNEHPGLLSLMLRILAEETGPVRAELLRTLGVLGALDPHAHRENEERLHGQGLLSMEGVRGVGRAGETKSPEELQVSLF